MNAHRTIPLPPIEQEHFQFQFTTGKGWRFACTADAEQGESIRFTDGEGRTLCTGVVEACEEHWLCGTKVVPSGLTLSSHLARREQERHTASFRFELHRWLGVDRKCDLRDKALGIKPKAKPKPSKKSKEEFALPRSIKAEPRLHSDGLAATWPTGVERERGRCFHSPDVRPEKGEKVFVNDELVLVHSVWERLPDNAVFFTGEVL